MKIWLFLMATTMTFITIRIKLGLSILVLFVSFQAWVIDYSLTQNLDEPKLRQLRDYKDGFK